MPQTFITRDFFKPMFDGSGYMDTANYRRRLEHNCDLRAVIVQAMDAVRIEGRLAPIPDVDLRDFAEGQAYNRFAENGPEGMSEADLKLATEILHAPMRAMIDAFMVKYLDSTGYLFDEAGAWPKLSYLARKLNSFLHDPQIHLRQRDWPEATAYQDQAFLDTTGEKITYLVQINGWLPALYERVCGKPWQLAAPLERPFA